MRWKYLKMLWSRIAKPRCYGRGGNLSSFNCALCAKGNGCMQVIEGKLQRKEDWEPVTFSMFSKAGEFYPKDRMNDDNLCGCCLDRPIWPNPKYCAGCMQNGCHTKFRTNIEYKFGQVSQG